jgi:hypothetical protein
MVKERILGLMEESMLVNISWVKSMGKEPTLGLTVLCMWESGLMIKQQDKEKFYIPMAPSTI